MFLRVASGGDINIRIVNGGPIERYNAQRLQIDLVRSSGDVSTSVSEAINAALHRIGGISG
jgi:hypothetical protein